MVVRVDAGRDTNVRTARAIGKGLPLAPGQPVFVEPVADHPHAPQCGDHARAHRLGVPAERARTVIGTASLCK